MGTAFVALHVESWEPHAESDRDVTLEIGRIVFRSLIEAMETERLSDVDWIGQLDAAYGIKWLYVGDKPDDSNFDFGPAFLRAIRHIRQNGPPDYYPERDMQLLHDQLDLLEKTYLELRQESD